MPSLPPWGSIGVEGHWSSRSSHAPTNGRGAQKLKKTWPDYLIEAESFYHAVSAECFHVLASETNTKNAKTSATSQQQKTWMLQRILMRLKAIKTTCGLMDSFSSLEDGAVPIDFTRLVYKQKKIVALPGFPWVTGLRPAGDGGLSRRRRSR